MNTKLKKSLECVGILLITIIIAVSSPFNPWGSGAYTQVQTEILDVAQAVRDGFLAYVEVDGHYGPVVYEFYGLGFLAGEYSQLVHFLMEMVMVCISVTFIYKTAKLYTSEVFAFVCTALVTIIGWGALTHAGAYEIMFFFFALTGYHIARQLKYGYLSYHTYLLAIDMTIMFFLQPAYTLIWICMFIIFAIKFKYDGVQGKEYRSFYTSILEGIFTVGIPMGLYLWYFKNGGAFLDSVVAYNFTNWGSFATGMEILAITPWTLVLLAFVVALIIKVMSNESITDLFFWIGYLVIAVLVIAAQADNLSSTIEIVKVIYIVPLASVFSLVDKPLGLKAEERKY